MKKSVNWKEVDALWRGLSAQPLNTPDASMQWLLEELKRLTNAEQSRFALSSRSAPHTEKEPDHMLGWRSIELTPCKSNPYQDMSFARTWAEDKSNTVGNECVIGIFRGAGTHRAMLMDDLVPGATHKDVKKDGLYRFYGVYDRLFALYALEPGLEVLFYVDRGEQPKFTARERETLRAVLQGLGPICLRLAMSHGALESQTRLTPRERETLLHLLHGLSEKELAAKMGLTVRSAHQNVVSVYRKLNVTSRPGLMSLWMNPPYASEVNNPDDQGSESVGRTSALWRDLLAQPVDLPDVALQWLLERLKVLTQSQQSACVITSKNAHHCDRDPDPMLGWRVVEWIPCDSNPYRDMSFAMNWVSDSSKTNGNKMVVGALEGGGKHRAFRLSDLMPDATPEDAKMDGLYRFYGVRDRLVGIFGLTPELEIFFYVDRETETMFSERDRQEVEALLHGLKPLCIRLAMSHGLLKTQTKLTARERETLLYLLKDLSEKEIAAEMGLTIRSAHQNVVSVYRKLNVSSRAGLMAQWMNPPYESEVSSYPSAPQGGIESTN